VWVAAVVLTGLAACGGDDSGDEAAAAKDTTSTAAAADDMTTTTAAADEAPATGGDFCTQVRGVLQVSKDVGLGPGNVPDSAGLQKIRDAQAAITPPSEIAAVWAENLKYADEGIAIAKEAEAQGSTAYEGPYLDRSMDLAAKQGPGASTINEYVEDHCGFSTQMPGA
jgi:hypothetical protein